MKSRSLITTLEYILRAWLGVVLNLNFSPFIFPHALLKGQTLFLLWTVLPLRPLVLTSLAVPFQRMLNPQIA